MEKPEDEIVELMEPIFYFCLSRLRHRENAEDLAEEILLYALDGMKRYQVTSLKAWVWRIANNRYARYLKLKNRYQEVPFEDNSELLEDIYITDAEETVNEHQMVFRCLHTLSAQYRDILVAYYVDGLSVKETAERLSLPESTIKWRLNAGREKIKKRMGDASMDKIYKRINWNTCCCNGGFDPDQYLHRQICRAICEACYEKPATLEEISLKTGIPALYIEDELPKLIYGDAIGKDGTKYAADFIILKLKERAAMEKVMKPETEKIADYLETVLLEREEDIQKIGFYGCDRGLKRLGYLLTCGIMRKEIRKVKQKNPEFQSGSFPPRNDGGYGWYLVAETEDEREQLDHHSIGCNQSYCCQGSIVYYNMGKYFDNSIDLGDKLLASKGIPEETPDGRIPEGILALDEIVELLRVNLIRKEGEGYRVNIPCFTTEQFEQVLNLFLQDDSPLLPLMEGIYRKLHAMFRTFVPQRLSGQINQWISCFIQNLTGYAVEELIHRGIIDGAEPDRPYTNGVFYISEKYGV